MNHTKSALVSGVLAAATLIPGLFAPCFTIIPSLGDPVLDAFVMNYFPESMQPKSFSIVGGVSSLFLHGDYGIGTIILVFSVLFPAAKIAIILLVSCIDVLPKRLQNGLRRIEETAINSLSHWGKASMLDVFVVAILIVGFKEFPGGTRIVRDWGIFCFAASVVLSIWSSSALRASGQMEHHDV